MNRTRSKSVVRLLSLTTIDILRGGKRNHLKYGVVKEDVGQGVL